MRPDFTDNVHYRYMVNHSVSLPNNYLQISPVVPYRCYLALKTRASGDAKLLVDDIAAVVKVGSDQYHESYYSRGTCCCMKQGTPM